MIKLYTFFHLNLMYSSISEKKRKEVINKCYWPIYELTQMGVPIGIEAPALTLELINSIDDNWINKLKKYISEKKIEFIGSGYSQVIGPLVPSKVNEKNQKIGIESYKELLDITPDIALINEMAFSDSIVEHYIQNKYRAILMEWNNAYCHNEKWKNEYLYYPQYIKIKNSEIPIIWCDTLGFQKFQRYVHGDINIEKYIDYIKSHLGPVTRFYPLYSNDVEIFNFRPGRYSNEASVKNDEWKRIIILYEKLLKENWCELIFPSNVLNGFLNDEAGNELRMSSIAQPIVVKKQEKYNIKRWALSGRNDIKINSYCYGIYNKLQNKKNSTVTDWKELCYLWSSDFRTHIETNRWENYLKLIKSVNEKYKINSKVDNDLIIEDDIKFKKLINNQLIKIKNNDFSLNLNPNKGLTIENLTMKNTKNSILGNIDFDYFDSIIYNYDYFSGHLTIDRPGFQKITDLEKSEVYINKDKNLFLNIIKDDSENYKIKKMINILPKGIEITKELSISNDEISIIHPFNFTFNIEGWDIKTLFIASNNGGIEFEKFNLYGKSVSHKKIYSALISSCHGFGNTEGKIIVGDKDKSLLFETYMFKSALIPSLDFNKIKDKYFFRLYYSAREMDETLKINSKPYKRLFKILIKKYKNL